MGLVNKPHDFHPHGPNAVISSEQVDENFDVLYDEVNGRLSDANVAPDAAIKQSKLDLSPLLIEHWMTY